MSDEEYRVDDLARLSGMTVRNIREHQSRGLLPAPTVRGRVGFYGPEHLTRLEQIKRLQADGFTLESIRRMLGGGAEFASFAAAVHQAFDDGDKRVVRLDDIHTLFPGLDRPDAGENNTDNTDNADTAALLESAVELGLLRPLGNGRFEERSPQLTRIGAELMALGIPPASALKAAAEARTHVQAVAKGFVQLYMDQIWAPFEAAGYPADQWPDILSGLDRLRPLALDSMLALMRMALDEAATRLIEERAGLR
ncbi:MerR family transcriptional regulator [Catenulispora rubra]|uniref:MerR family transcriptional regulator n=1 Tax=Catenulispora rubra TaxID=280293 RepID=UPI0018920EEC|nr:MerR family transcriptional regulator [Catenulispora rubra]